MEGGGGKGVHLGFSGNVFFIVERVGKGSSWVIFFYKFIMGQAKGCTGGLGCTLIFFFFFLLLRGEGVGG